MENKNQYLYIPKLGYLFIEKVLVKIKSFSGTIDLSTGLGEVTFKFEDGTNYHHYDYNYTKENLPIYDSCSDFEKGIRSSYFKLMPTEIVASAYSSLYYKCKTNASGQKIAYTIDNDRICEVNISEGKFRIQNLGTSVKMTSEIKIPVYSSREEALLFYDYSEVTKEGTIEHPSLNSKMKFTKEQENCLAYLEKALARCKENNILLVHNINTDTLKAFNTNNVDFSLDYEYSLDMSSIGKELTNSLWTQYEDEKLQFIDK